MVTEAADVFIEGVRRWSVEVITLTNVVDGEFFAEEDVDLEAIVSNVNEEETIKLTNMNDDLSQDETLLVGNWNLQSVFTLKAGFHSGK